MKDAKQQHLKYHECFWANGEYFSVFKSDRPLHLIHRVMYQWKRLKDAKSIALLWHLDHCPLLSVFKMIMCEERKKTYSTMKSLSVTHAPTSLINCLTNLTFRKIRLWCDLNVSVWLFSLLGSVFICSVSVEEITVWRFFLFFNPFLAVVCPVLVFWLLFCEKEKKNIYL